MERKEFIKLMGVAGVGALIGCSLGCKKEQPTLLNVDFTLDLNDPAYAKLKQNGGYIYKDQIIIARTLQGIYLAVAKACTHEGVDVSFLSSNGTFYCSAHGSQFNPHGGVINGPATIALQEFKVTLSGSSLRVQS